jgi:hypothetical protein
MELINKEDWGKLKSSLEFSKYREYQRLFLEFIKDQWADGNFLEELENAEASGKAQLLRDMVALDYDDIRKFFIEAGHIKETNSEQDIDDEG